MATSFSMDDLYLVNSQRKILYTVVLIDNHVGGHHLAYLRLYTKALLDLGCRVMTLSREPNAVKSWISTHYPQFTPQVQTFAIGGTEIPKFPLIRKLPQPIAILERWRQAAIAVQNYSDTIGWHPDLVFFNWLDSYFSHYLTPFLIDRIFPYPWAGLYFQVGDLRFQPHTLPIINKPLIHYGIANSSRCQALGVLDETWSESLQKSLKTQVILFPDITDEVPPDRNYSIAQQIRDKAGKRKIIGLIGSLSRRKGILTLLKVAQKSMEENWLFVFVGQLSEDGFSLTELNYLKSLIHAPLKNCFFHLKPIPDEPQFNALIETFDILFCAYENYPYSSNLLTKAAAFKKPVIVSQGFCMAERVNKFNLGITIPEGDAFKCKEAIQNLSALSNYKFGFETFKAWHSSDQLIKIFNKILFCIY